MRNASNRTALTLSTAAAVLALAACAGTDGRMPMSGNMTQASLPEAVKVPAGHKVAMETVGVGQITYECRAKAGMAGAHEWFFVGPKAMLNDRRGMQVGSYYGPPATWESRDGSRLTGTQLAVAPAGSGNIPLQLVQANPAMGAGAMSGVTYIQRLATRGGAAPAMPCGSGNLGAQQIVDYQSDYIFWKAS